MSLPPLPPVVEEYFASLEENRRESILPVFTVVHEAMPDGYELVMGYGMPSWVIPFSIYPNTYNKQPLVYAGLAAQKHYNSLYLTGLYSNPEVDSAFREEWAATGRKLNMGKSCLRFKSREDIDLDIIARAVAAVPVERFLETYERINPPIRSAPRLVQPRIEPGQDPIPFSERHPVEGGRRVAFERLDSKV